MTVYYAEVLTSDGLRVMKFDSVRGGFVESYPILKPEKKVEKKAPAVHERREVKKKVKVLPDANLESSEKEEEDVVKFLQYLDRCAGEVREFLSPELQASERGKYPPRKLREDEKKPQREKEVQKPFWTVIMGDPRVPYAEKSKCLLKWIREETEKYGRKN